MARSVWIKYSTLIAFFCSFECLANPAPHPALPTDAAVWITAKEDTLRLLTSGKVGVDAIDPETANQLKKLVSDKVPDFSQIEPYIRYSDGRGFRDYRYADRIGVEMNAALSFEALIKGHIAMTRGQISAEELKPHYLDYAVSYANALKLMRVLLFDLPAHDSAPYEAGRWKRFSAWTAGLAANAGLAFAIIKIAPEGPSAKWIILATTLAIEAAVIGAVAVASGNQAKSEGGRTFPELQATALRRLAEKLQIPSDFLRIATQRSDGGLTQITEQVYGSLCNLELVTPPSENAVELNYSKADLAKILPQ